jgi:protein phosphatase
MVAIAAAEITDVGLVRAINEDAVVAVDPVYIVADGMGGHDAGEVASALAVEELARLTGFDQPVTEDDVKVAVAAAHQRISRLANRLSGRAAGTTISGAVIIEKDGQLWWMVINLGDSRTYRLTHTNLVQLSVDHSEVQELVNRGRITQAEARGHPRRNVVTRALGAGVAFEPDYWLIPVRAGERLLVCSDGLTSEVDDSRIRQLLLAHSDPLEAAQALVGEALRLGGSDNISVIVADVVNQDASQGTSQDGD